MKVTSGTREWADQNVNCFYGCSYDCRYCYAKMMADRYGRVSKESWKNMLVNQGAVDRKYPCFKGRVMFPSTHDITDDPEVQRVCFDVLKKLLVAGNNVLVTTKPDFNVTQNLIKEFSKYKDQIQFRFTIGSNNDETLQFWEPNAPPYKVRLESLKLAKESGFKTSVSIEPFLDYDPIPLVIELMPFITESIWIGPMNYIPRNNIPEEFQPKYNQIRENYMKSNIVRIIERLRNEPKIRFKDSMIRLSKLTESNLYL